MSVQGGDDSCRGVLLSSAMFAVQILSSFALNYAGISPAGQNCYDIETVWVRLCSLTWTQARLGAYFFHLLLTCIFFGFDKILSDNKSQLTRFWCVQMRLWML